MSRFAAGIAATAMAGAVLICAPAGISTAHADPTVTAVGGGAWAIGVGHFTENLVLQSHNVPYGFAVFHQTPQVTLPTDGSADTIEATGPTPTVGPISAMIGHVTTQGTLNGTPFAHSTAQVSNIVIPGLDLSAVNTECVWNGAGATASTVLVDVNGHPYSVPPNTAVPLPGGFASLNNQYLRHDDTTNRDVITVAGVQLFTYTQGPAQTYVYTEIDLGLASCDPLNVPSVTQVFVKGGT